MHILWNCDNKNVNRSYLEINNYIPAPVFQTAIRTDARDFLDLSLRLAQEHCPQNLHCTMHIHMFLVPSGSRIKLITPKRDFYLTHKPQT